MENVREDIILIKNGQNLEQMIDDVARYKDHKKNIQYANLFKAEIKRVAPTPLDIDRMYITGVSISYENIELEEVKIGSGYMQIIRGITASGISITFEESRDEKIKSFLLMDDKKPIIPRDGTYLLAEGYYFDIDIKSVPLLGDENEYTLIKGSFVIEGQVQKDLQTGENSFLGLTASFKAMNSQSVSYS